MSYPTDFEVRLHVLDDEGEVTHSLLLEYPIPYDSLDLEDTLMYVSSDLSSALKPHLPKS